MSLFMCIDVNYDVHSLYSIAFPLFLSILLDTEPAFRILICIKFVPLLVYRRLLFCIYLASIYWILFLCFDNLSVSRLVLFLYLLSYLLSFSTFIFCICYDVLSDHNIFLS